jgi:predicted PilT family ATPase
MLEATLKSINSEILKLQSIAEEGDTRIISSTNMEKSLVISDELLFEEEQVHLYLSFSPTLKKIKCVFYITEIDPEFVETMIRQVGLPVTTENIQNYQRDPTLIEKFWNETFIKKYNELMKYFRKNKMAVFFKEKFPPAFNKNRNNEVVDNFG